MPAQIKTATTPAEIAALPWQRHENAYSKLFDTGLRDTRHRRVGVRLFVFVMVPGKHHVFVGSTRSDVPYGGNRRQTVFKGSEADALAYADRKGAEALARVQAKDEARKIAGTTRHFLRLP